MVSVSNPDKEDMFTLALLTGKEFVTVENSIDAIAGLLDVIVPQISTYFLHHLSPHQDFLVAPRVGCVSWYVDVNDSKSIVHKPINVALGLISLLQSAVVGGKLMFNILAMSSPAQASLTMALGHP